MTSTHAVEREVERATRPVARQFPPPPKNPLLNVVGFEVAESGTFCILEDGRMYEKVLDDWMAYMPPLTKAQRTPR